MHPLSDKDLERLSREAAEQYDVEQNTSGWDKLEQKLNKHLPEKGKKERHRFLFFIWLFALLSGGGLLWMLTGSRSSRMMTLKEGSSEVSVPGSTKQPTNQAPAGTRTQADKQNQPDRSSKEPITDEANELVLPNIINPENTITGKGGKESATVASPDKNITQNQPGDRMRLSASDKKARPRKGMPGRRNNTVKAAKNNNSLSSPTVVIPSGELTSTEHRDRKATSDAIPLSDIKKDQEEFPSPTPDPAAVNEKAWGLDSATQATTNETKTETDSIRVVKKAKDRKASGFKKGLQVGLVVAPDMSNVKFTNTDKVGYNIGVQLGYRLSQRWSVNTGVIYTRKNYTSQGKDFNPPKGSWIDNVTLDLVKGNCYMFDIPLNVRYDLNNGKNHRYFVSTGLSTYLMKKEEYHYHYQYANGNPGYRYRSSSSDENHFLSVLNISAGFERKVSNRLSVQAEPYFKIPLSGVGYGNLQLHSYGMYFLLKFNTNKRSHTNGH